MTFQEAREKHLKWLDLYYQNLRDAVADPAWTNDDWAVFKDRFKLFVDRIELIRQLNAAEVEA